MDLASDLMAKQALKQVFPPELCLGNLLNLFSWLPFLSTYSSLRASLHSYNTQNILMQDILLTLFLP